MIVVWNEDLNASKVLPWCQRWMNLPAPVEHSHSVSRQKPVKQSSLENIFHIKISKGFACTKHVLTWDWAGLSPSITTQSPCRKHHVQAKAPALMLGTSVPSSPWLPRSCGGDGHCGLLQLLVSLLSRLGAWLLSDLRAKFLSHEKEAVGRGEVGGR